LHRESLAMFQGLLGEKHRHVATSLNNLAVVLENIGKQEEAEVCRSEAAEISNG